MDDNVNKALDRIETKFDKIEVKIDAIESHANSINETLIRNTISLEEHIRRTALLEQKIEPLESHVALMKNIVAIVIFVGILAAIYKNIR